VDSRRQEHRLRILWSGSTGHVLDFDFSQTGTFAYVKEKREPWSIFWLNSAGRVQPLHLTPGFYVGPRFSPDGKRLAFAMRTEPLRADIWVKDLDRDTMNSSSGLTQPC
jgi:Tol biopolymer transport system component